MTTYNIILEAAFLGYHNMKLLARDQWVGDGSGYYFKRDLWQDKNGNRISIRKGEGIWRESIRKVNK